MLRRSPVAFFSHTLTNHEKNYAQVDKESLTIIAGLTKSHQYIWNRHVNIVTDHKSLLGLLGSDQAVLQMTSSRMQRWANIPHADAPNCLPLATCPDHVPVPEETYYSMVPLWRGQFSPKSSQNRTHSSPVRVFCGFKFWSILCPSHRSDICNIMLYWTAL